MKVAYHLYVPVGLQADWNEGQQSGIPVAVVAPNQCNRLYRLHHHQHLPLQVISRKDLGRCPHLAER